MDPDLLIDADRLWRDLMTFREIGRDPAGGVTRLMLSPEDLDARRLLREELADIGIPVREDAAANQIARWDVESSGSDGLPAAIAFGSHLDTVPQGGAFDGALGVLAGIEVLRTLKEAGYRPHHPLELINFTGEEGIYTGNLFGSRAMTGRLEPSGARQEWESRGPGHLPAGLDGKLDFDRIEEAARSRRELAAFLELHIEQGPRLAEGNADIGLVQGIVGLASYQIEVPGRAGHVGTTPMGMRDDALVKAARFIQSVPGVVGTFDDSSMVTTVGKVDVNPGAPNVIPGRVFLSLDLRAQDDGMITQAEKDLKAKLQEVAPGSLWHKINRVPPAPMNEDLLHRAAGICRDRQVKAHTLYSGAGHDAQNMATRWPTLMLFVPSRDGISHSPHEWTEPAACAHGAQVLLDLVCTLDRL